MATVPVRLETTNAGVTIVTWTGLANGDDGSPVDLSGYSHLTVQATGSFGLAGNVRLEGRNVSGGSFGAMAMGTTDGFGDADLADSSVRALAGTALEVRPRVTAGDLTTDLTVVITAT